MLRWKIDVTWIARALAAGTAIAVFAASRLAWAAQTQQQEFVPAADITKESLPASPLLFGAYAFVWIALIAYVFLLWRRIGRVEHELADVTAKLANRR